MTQYIKPGGKQVSDPPKPTVRHSQQSLFGNGQSTKPPRDIKAEEQRAKEKFAKTQAGKVQVSDYRDPHAKQSAKAAAPQKGECTRKPCFNDHLCRAGNCEFQVGNEGKGTGQGKGGYGICHHSHPPYPVAPGFVVYGGSGIHPHITDCDVYVSLDHARVPGPKSLPWSGGHDFVFNIKNYGVPEDPAAFRQLIEWLAIQVKLGVKVHVGCMAGHGRTGMVFAALHMHLTSDKQAIQHVRAHYCDQVVETDAQVKWLMAHWGIDTAPPRVKKDKGSSKTASQAGAIKHGDWKNPASQAFDADDAFGFQAPNLMDLDAREPSQTSWQANSPWQVKIEGPKADLGEQAWYDEDEKDGAGTEAAE